MLLISIYSLRSIQCELNMTVRIVFCQSLNLLLLSNSPLQLCKRKETALPPYYHLLLQHSWRPPHHSGPLFVYLSTYFSPSIWPPTQVPTCNFISHLTSAISHGCDPPCNDGICAKKVVALMLAVIKVKQYVQVFCIKETSLAQYYCCVWINNFFFFYVV